MYDYEFEEENDVPRKAPVTQDNQLPPTSNSQSSLIFRAVADVHDKVDIKPAYLSKGLAPHIQACLPEAFESHVGVAALKLDDDLVAILKFALEKPRSADFIALISRDSHFSEFLNIVNWTDTFYHNAIPWAPLSNSQRIERKNIKIGVHNSAKALRGLLFFAQVTFNYFGANAQFLNEHIIPPVMAGFDLLFDHIRRFRKHVLDLTTCPLGLKLRVIEAPCTKIWALSEDLEKELSKYKPCFRGGPLSSARGRGFKGARGWKISGHRGRNRSFRTFRGRGIRTRGGRGRGDSNQH